MEATGTEAELFERIRRLHSQTLEALIETDSKGVFDALNAALAPEVSLPRKKGGGAPCWIQSIQGFKGLVWAEIPPRFTVCNYNIELNSEYTFQGKPLPILPSVGAINDTTYQPRNGRHVWPELWEPECVSFVDGGREPVLVYSGVSWKRPGPLGPIARFPASWDNVLGTWSSIYDMKNVLVLNGSHPCVVLARNANEHEFVYHPYECLKLSAEEMCRNSRRCASWVIAMARSQLSANPWQAIVDKYGTWLWEVLRSASCMLDGEPSLFVSGEHDYTGTLIVQKGLIKQAHRHEEVAIDVVSRVFPILEPNQAIIDVRRNRVLTELHLAHERIRAGLPTEGASKKVQLQKSKKKTRKHP